MVKTVAVCAGSGASVIQGVKADLYITGMSHTAQKQTKADVLQFIEIPEYK